MSLVRANFCGQSGDSGAPVYADGVALGLHQGGFGSPSCNSLFTPIRAVERVMNVDIVHEQPPAGVGIYKLRNSLFAGESDMWFMYGAHGDRPVVGDWDGDGRDTIGTYRPSDLKFYLRNSNTAGSANIAPFVYGSAEYTPLAGDWNGDGRDTIGIWRPHNATFALRDSNSSGRAEYDFAFGRVGDVPVVGDWNGDGRDTVGVYRPSDLKFYLRNSNTEGAADITPFVYGSAEYLPLAGDWNNDGVDTIGVYRPYNGSFALRNENSSGIADIFVPYGSAEEVPAISDVPVAGDWDGDLRATVGIFQN